MEVLGQRLDQRKKQLMAQFSGGNLPPPTTRSYTGHKLLQSEPVEAAAD
jgi:hypothetical protein